MAPLDAFVINMDRSTDRLASIGAHLAERQLFPPGASAADVFNGRVPNAADASGLVRFHRLPAVNGRALMEEAAARGPNAQIASSPPVSGLCTAQCTPGIIGCFASHHAVWSAIVDNNLPAALVLEDDSRFVGTAQDVRTALIDLHALVDNGVDGEPFDMLFLGGHGVMGNGAATAQMVAMNDPYGHIVHRMLAGFGKRATADPVGAAAFSAAATAFRGAQSGMRVHEPTFPIGFYGLLITNAGARKLLAAFPRITYHVDVAVAALHARAPGTVRLLACTTPVVTTATMESTINGTTTAHGRNRRSVANAVGSLYVNRHQGITLQFILTESMFRAFGTVVTPAKILFVCLVVTTAVTSASRRWVVSSGKLGAIATVTMLASLGAGLAFTAANIKRLVDSV
jgi:GR25 family glycosyltransferase involved in LPS biosynthesis